MLLRVLWAVEITIALARTRKTLRKGAILNWLEGWSWFEEHGYIYNWDGPDGYGGVHLCFNRLLSACLAIWQAEATKIEWSAWNSSSASVPYHVDPENYRLLRLHPVPPETYYLYHAARVEVFLVESSSSRNGTWGRWKCSSSIYNWHDSFLIGNWEFTTFVRIPVLLDFEIHSNFLSFLQSFSDDDYFGCGLYLRNARLHI